MSASDHAAPIEARLSEFKNKRILVLGDAILDEYLHGECSRISPEAPVPVVRVTGSRRVLGGLAPTGATYFRMESWALPAGLKHGRTVGWEVEALSGDDLLMVSSTRELRVP